MFSMNDLCAVEFFFGRGKLICNIWRCGRFFFHLSVHPQSTQEIRVVVEDHLSHPQTVTRPTTPGSRPFPATETAGCPSLADQGDFA